MRCVGTKAPFWKRRLTTLGSYKRSSTEPRTLRCVRKSLNRQTTLSCYASRSVWVKFYTCNLPLFPHFELSALLQGLCFIFSIFNLWLSFSGARNAGTTPWPPLIWQHLIDCHFWSCPTAAATAASAAPASSEPPVSDYQCRWNHVPEPPWYRCRGHWGVSASLIPVPAILKLPGPRYHQQPPGSGKPQLCRTRRQLRVSTLPRRWLGRHSHGRWVYSVPR